MTDHITTGRRPATYQDVLDAPENVVAELIRGALHLHPRPASPHARAASLLAVEIGSPFDRGRGGPGGWCILFEPELHLGPDVLVPDLAGWRRERMPSVPDVRSSISPPTGCCEVLSPGTRRLDLNDKRRHLRGRRRRLPLVRRSDRTDPRCLRAPRRSLGAGCRIQGRRGSARRALRCGRDPAVGALAGRGVRRVTFTP